jgi:regulatory protein
MEEMALAYVARFAVSESKLQSYLARKYRERGWEEEGADVPALIAALVARFVSAGYVDDASYARMKSGSLLRRGYGQRRIGQALGQDGIDEAIRAEVAPDQGAARAAALAYARKKRLGPYAREGAMADPAMRQKQLAAMLRAGHDMGVARTILDFAEVDSAEEWVAQAQDAADQEAGRTVWDW